MKTRLKKIWSTSWRVGLCLVLLTWIFHSIFLNEGRLEAERQGQDWSQLSRAEQWHQGWTVGPQELWHTLRLIHPVPFAFSLVLFWCTVALGVARWRMVLKVQGLDLPMSRAMNISYVAQFFNSFLLGSTGGDLIKAYYAARETHHLKTEAVTTVFVDRMIGLWAMLLFAGLMTLPNLGLILHHQLLAGVVVFVLCMLVAATVGLYLAFWGGVSKRWPRARVWLRRLPKGELLERSLDSCRQFGRHKMFLLKAVAISLAVNMVAVLQVVVVAYGLGMDLRTMDLCLIVPVVICISALPITPAGLGVRETLFVRLLAAPMIGASATAALSLSLVTYSASLFWSLVGGGVYLGIKKKQHLEEVTHADPNAAGETEASTTV